MYSLLYAKNAFSFNFPVMNIELWFDDADNLLLTANQKSVKLADFGLAREETVTEMMTAETGTYRWMAPEVCILRLMSFDCLY